MKRPPFKRPASVEGRVTLVCSDHLWRELSSLGLSELPEPKDFAIKDGELLDVSEVARYFLITEGTQLIESNAKVIFGSLSSGAKYTITGDVDNERIVQAGGVSLAMKNEALLKELCPKANRIAFAFDPIVLQHIPPNDRVPEAPQRIGRAIEQLKSHPILGHFSGLSGESSPSRRILCRNATPQEIYLAHNKELYQHFVETGSSLANNMTLPSDVYCLDDGASQKAVLASCGLTIDALHEVACPNVNGEHLDGAFCLIRPPGHHCGHASPNGFCLVNNVVVAVRVLLEKNPTFRVAIVDCDVHHGEGTQSLVEMDDRILYYSTHRCDNGTFFPYGKGKKDSFGLNNQCINVAFDTAAHIPAECHKVISDVAFNVCTDRVLTRALEKFQPTVVVVSCGFDALFGDPLGKMAVTINGYRNLIAALQGKYKIVAVLEGGYNSEAVSHGVAAVFSTMLFGSGVSQRLLAEIDPLVNGSAKSAQNQSQPAALPQTWESLRGKLGSASSNPEPRPSTDAAIFPDDIALEERHSSWIDSTINELLAIHPYFSR